MAENNTPRIHDEKRENVLPQVAIRMIQERPLISTEKMDYPCHERVPKSNGPGTCLCSESAKRYETNQYEHRKYGSFE